MSICEHMIGTCDSEEIDVGQSPEEKFLNIQNELIWGLTYRNYKENEKKKPMLPVHSPVNIPFELCRAEMLLGHKKKMHPSFSKGKFAQDQDKGSGEGADKKPDVKPKGAKKRKIPREKPTLLDRNVWSQNKYMNFLSVPNPKFYEEPSQKKYKKRCELEPCPPRFIQLAVPNKRKVFANWKEYANFLPTEVLMRFEEILHTDQNLEPREARYYYKKLDRQKRKELKKKRRLEKKKKLEKEKDSNWQKAQIDILAKEIVDYIQDEPLFTLNYKQMLLSDGILDRIERTKIMKKPSRKTKNHYKKTIIEVSDKFAIWIDTLTRFVDVQAIESDEDIPPVSISSLSAEGESEGESEYESSSEEDLRDEQLFEEQEGIWGEEGIDMEDGIGKDVVEGLMDDLFRPGEGEGADDLTNMLGGLDGELLEKLIKILSNCSDEYLDGEIDADQLPGVKYRDVLDRLKALRDGTLDASGETPPILEQIMIDWAVHNEPDNVDDDILQTIHEVAGLLGDFLGGKPPGWAEGGEGTDGEEGGLRTPGEGDGMGVGEGGFSEGADDDGRLSQGTLLEGLALSEAEGGAMTPVTPTDLSDLEGEEGLGYGEVPGPGEEPLIGAEGEEVSILFEPPSAAEGEVPEGEGLEGRIIKGHKPPQVFEHSPDTVCCLSLKTWAVWLLEITHNAHNWTQWMSCVIQKVREYAAIVRGDVKDEKGQTKVLPKAEWRKFIAETEESVVAWRQYSAHVKDLSQSIIENFHGKKVNCCPKCLQDHLIKNVVVAHDTLQALTEAISCAAYWQRCLDTLVDKTCGLTRTKEDDDQLGASSEDSDEDADLEDVDDKGEESGESIYEIEGLEEPGDQQEDAGKPK